MNKLLTTLLAVGVFASVQQASAQAGAAPTAPSLAEALKHPNTKVLAFRPTRMGADSSLNFTHIRLGDGSVKPGEKRGVLLVVYASDSVNGDNKILMQDFHFLSNEGSPVLKFAPFHGRANAPDNIDQQGRVGIIAVLIGYSQNLRTNAFTPTALPPIDSISAEINPDNPALIGLLLPAVQKVRSAAAR